MDEPDDESTQSASGGSLRILILAEPPQALGIERYGTQTTRNCKVRSKILCILPGVIESSDEPSVVNPKKRQGYGLGSGVVRQAKPID